MPPPRPLGAAEDVVGADADQAGDDLGEAELLAVAAVAYVGAENGDRSVTVPLDARSQRSAGGKLSGHAPAMMTGIGGRSG